MEEKAKADAEAKAKEAEDKSKADEEVRQKNFQIWQGQLKEMEDRNMIPKMTKEEKGDPGFDARVELYGYLQVS